MYYVGFSTCYAEKRRGFAAFVYDYIAKSGGFVVNRKRGSESPDTEKGYQVFGVCRFFYIFARGKKVF